MKLTFNKLFVFSKDYKKSFEAKFGSGVNIVYGPNTSGKSTLFQLLVYVFGINEYNVQLTELLQEDIVVRLDCTLIKENGIAQLTIVRNVDFMAIKEGNKPTQRFNGLSANQSQEHVRLKECIGEILDFTLFLEAKAEFKQAPIEALFLPYYVSQSLGWIYLRKSFAALDWYKNFKNDYLDYYLGVDSNFDRLERQRLSDRLNILKMDQSFYLNFESNNDQLVVAKIADEKFTEMSIEYVKGNVDNRSNLLKMEKDYILKCNQLAVLEQRKLLLAVVNRNHLKQEPGNDKCPTCEQAFPSSLKEIYYYKVERNDSAEELKILNQQIKDLAGTINSLDSKITQLKASLAKSYQVLQSYTEQAITYDNWLDNKTNVKLSNAVLNKIGTLAKEIDEVQKHLNQFKTPEQVENERRSKSEVFKLIFKNYAQELGVKELTEDRFTDVYKISAFPSLGVELHKTIMAYHFAFNYIIRHTSYIHRLPFMLDAIFKEDIDEKNKMIILEFIDKWKPADTQIIFSIANDLDIDKIPEYAGKFKIMPTQIQIGDGKTKRSLLRNATSDQYSFISETLILLEGNLDNLNGGSIQEI